MKRNSKFGEFLIAALIVIGMSVLVAAILIGVGLLIILSLNTLFPALAIPYGVATVASVLFLLVCFQGQATVTSK